MDRERISGLGLEPMLTTSELAEHLGVQSLAIYDLRADGRGPLRDPSGPGAPLPHLRRPTLARTPARA